MPHRPPSHGQLLRLARGRRDQDAEYELRRKRDPVLSRTQRIRNTSRWQRVRTRLRARQNLCQECLAHGRIEPATQVDHLVPLGERPDLAFDPRNLRGLCDACHARKNAQERRRARP